MGKKKTAFHDSFQESEILWKDRKRICGLPITFSKYSLDKDRLYFKKGFFASETNELLLYRVLDIKSNRNLWQKICRVGSVSLYSADKSDSILVLKNIRKSDKVRKFLSVLIEQRRNEKGITGRELYGASGFSQSGDILPDADGDGVPDIVDSD
ncbi:MAG: PH domain-containing protein [Eubacteriales bacterium]|nr:PH domain-containing protein [Eubacteriales bacterium]